MGELGSILFYSPYMGYTGSEVALKNVINNARKVKPVLLSGDKGDLVKEIVLEVPKFFISHSRAAIYMEKFLRKAGFFKFLPNVRLIKTIISKYRISGIVLNTLDIRKVYYALKEISVPIVLWCHELLSNFNILRDVEFEFLLKKTKGVIGCSKKVCEAFSLLGIHNVYTYYEPIDISTIIVDESLKNEVRERHREFTFLIGMSGQQNYIKGFHFILDILPFLEENNIGLIWLGKSNPYGLNYFVREVINQKGSRNIILTGELRGKEYYSHLSAIDLFLLLSVEDPYPIVMLESAYLEKPIVGFDSGGISEFVKEGMGVVVPKYNFKYLFDAILGVKNGNIKIDYELLRREAIKHNVKNRIDEFEDILMKCIG